jgi:hypothetical protein
MLKVLISLGYQYTNTIQQTLADFYLQMASIVRQQERQLETTNHALAVATADCVSV